MKNKVLATLLKYVNVRGLIFEAILQDLLKNALDKLAADSSNPYDDLAVAALYPPLEAAIKKQIEEFLAKIEAEAAS